MPASYYHFVSRSRAQEHFLDALTSDEVRKDTKGVHAHAGQSSGIVLPEFVVSLVNIIGDTFVQFNGIS